MWEEEEGEKEQRWRQREETGANGAATNRWEGRRGHHRVGKDAVWPEGLAAWERRAHGLPHCSLVSGFAPSHIINTLIRSPEAC